VAFDEHEDAATIAHLAACQNCQREVASYAALRATLRRGLEPEPARFWAMRPTTMEEIMRATQATEREQGAHSRTPLAVRHSRATTLWGGLVTALVIVGVALLAIRLSPTAPVAGVRGTPEPVPPTVSMLLAAVPPSLSLADDQRVGVTIAGLTRLYGPPNSATPTPTGQMIEGAQPIATWTIPPVDRPFLVRAYGVEASSALDHQPHVTSIFIGPASYEQSKDVYNPTMLAALALSFLPSDAHYTGDQTLSGSNIPIHVYHSEAMARLFSPDPDHVFTRNSSPPKTPWQTPMVSAPAPPGTVSWVCTLNTGTTIQSNTCGIFLGS
jgi:hypothetical protein